MFASFLVTFREILEIALIVGVVLAATKGVQGRWQWLLLGFTGGVIGSGVVALFTETISSFAEGLGQELFNALIVFSASIVIGWTAIWMRIHAREMVRQIKDKGGKIVQGELPKITLSLIIMLAVLREGSEIVLFTYGMLASGQDVYNLIIGVLLGAAAGICVGGVLYFGIVKIPTKYIFQVTTWMLLLLAAGMSSVGAKYLVAAGYVEHGIDVLWDISHILQENSVVGQILHALLGYSDRPMVVQVVFYVLTLVFFCVLMYILQKKSIANSNFKTA